MKCSKSGKGAFLVSLVLMVLFTSVALGQGPNAKTPGEGLNANETNHHNVPGGMVEVSHDSEVGKLTQEICKANRAKFPDCNMVMPGDTVRVDADHLYTVEPWMWKANHGCIWQIAKMHLYGQNNPDTNDYTWWAPPFTPNPNSATPFPAKTETDGFQWWHLLVILFLIILGIMAATLYHWHREDYDRDPSNFKPVIQGGLSQDPAQAVLQIANLDPDRNITNPIVKTELGHLVCHPHAVKTFAVQMVFGDGQTRIVDIHDGDTAYRVTRQDGTVEYYRTQCGNAYGLIGLGRADFELPGAWSFIIDGHWTAPATTPTTANPIPTPEANSATAAPAVAPAPTASETTPAPVTSPTPATEEAKPATTSEVQLPAPDPTTDDRLHQITVEISDGTNTITVKATGDKANMPTRVEHTPGSKTVVFFPRGESEK